MTKNLSKKIITSIIIIVFFVVLSVGIYFIPFYYCGNFDLRDYEEYIEQYSKVYTEDLDATRYLLPETENIKNIFDAYGLAKACLQLDYPDYRYRMYYDKNTGAWLIDSEYMRWNILVETQTLILSSSGEILVLGFGAIY